MKWQKSWGNLLGKFVEVDGKESNRLGSFLRVKATIDLRKPLKRGTVIKYQGKNLQIYFKYERLPRFCFVCGKLGHQIKDCKEIEGKEETEFEDIEEKELPFGKWLRASSLPKITGEVKKDTSTGSCSKSLFSASGTSKEATKDKEISFEVEQRVEPDTAEHCLVEGSRKKKEESQADVECVAESLSTVSISGAEIGKFDKGSHTKPKNSLIKTKKWARKKGVKKGAGAEPLAAELGKRLLVATATEEDDPMKLCRGEPKRRMSSKGDNAKKPEGVLDDQHLLPQ
jgi:hypothetical protein